VVAVDLSAGTVRWQVEAEASALAAGGSLLFIASAENLEARDAGTAAPRWHFAAGEKLAPVLTWNGGWLLAGTVNGEAIMFRASDGKVLWRSRLGAVLRGRAAMTGDRVYLLLSDGRVEARNLIDGEQIWQSRLAGEGTAMLALDDRLFVGAEDKFLHCLSAEDGDRRWRWRTGGSVIGTPAADEGRIYFLALDNVLRALDRGNGHLRWQRNLGFRPASGPFLANAILIVAGVAPDIALFRADNGAPAGKVAAAGDPAAEPYPLPGKSPEDFSLMVLTRDGRLQRLGPPPPVLQSKPVPGLPAYVPIDLWGRL
jgi:outer membrane protein assembly factor BamB